MLHFIQNSVLDEIKPNCPKILFWKKATLAWQMEESVLVGCFGRKLVIAALFSSARQSYSPNLSRVEFFDAIVNWLLCQYLVGILNRILTACAGSLTGKKSMRSKIFSLRFAILFWAKFGVLGPNLNALIASQSSAVSANSVAGKDLDITSFWVLFFWHWTCLWIKFLHKIFWGAGGLVTKRFW